MSLCDPDEMYEFGGAFYEEFPQIEAWYEVAAIAFPAGRVEESSGKGLPVELILLDGSITTLKISAYVVPAVEAALSLPGVEVLMWTWSDNRVYGPLVYDETGFAFIGNCTAEKRDLEFDRAYGDEALDVIDEMVGTFGGELHRVLRVDELTGPAPGSVPTQMSPDLGIGETSAEVPPMVPDALPTDESAPITFPEVTSPPGLIPRRIWLSVPADVNPPDVIVCARSALAAGGCMLLSSAAGDDPLSLSVYDTESDPGPISIAIRSVSLGAQETEGEILVHRFEVAAFADAAEPSVRVTELPPEVIEAARFPDAAILSSDELHALIVTETVK